MIVFFSALKFVYLFHALYNFILKQYEVRHQVLGSLFSRCKIQGVERVTGFQFPNFILEKEKEPELRQSLPSLVQCSFFYHMALGNLTTLFWVHLGLAYELLRIEVPKRFLTLRALAKLLCKF